MSSSEETIRKALQTKDTPLKRRALVLCKASKQLPECPPALQKEVVTFLVTNLESCALEDLSAFLDLATSVSKVGFDAFSERFCDVANSLMAWRIRPDLARSKAKLSELVEATIRSFGKFWTAHADFSRDILRKIAADIHTIVDKLSQRDDKQLELKLIGIMEYESFATSRKKELPRQRSSQEQSETDGKTIGAGMIVIDCGPVLLSAAKKAFVKVGKQDVRASTARMAQAVGKMAQAQDGKLIFAALSFFETSLAHTEDDALYSTQVLYLPKLLVPTAALKLFFRPGGIYWRMGLIDPSTELEGSTELLDELVLRDSKLMFRELLPQAFALVSYITYEAPMGEKKASEAWTPCFDEITRNEGSTQLTTTLIYLLKAIHNSKPLDLGQLRSFAVLVRNLKQVHHDEYPWVPDTVLMRTATLFHRIDLEQCPSPECKSALTELACHSVGTLFGPTRTQMDFGFMVMTIRATMLMKQPDKIDTNLIFSACCDYICYGNPHIEAPMSVFLSFLPFLGKNLSYGTLSDLVITARYLALSKETVSHAANLSEYLIPLVTFPLSASLDSEERVSTLLSNLPPSQRLDPQQFSAVMARLRLSAGSAGLTKKFSRALFNKVDVAYDLGSIIFEDWVNGDLGLRLDACALSRWVVDEAAKFCVVAKLRTPLGDPKQTLESIEGMLLQVGQGRADNINQTALRHLLLFVDAMERNILIAAEGCRALRCFTLGLDPSEFGTMSPAKKARYRASEVFFRANRKVCVDWFSRMRQGLLAGAITNGEPFEIVRHSTQRLNDILRGSHAGKNAGEVRLNIEATLMNLSSALVSIREPDAILGLVEYFSSKKPGQMFSKILGKEAAEHFLTFLHSLSLKAASMYERAASEMMPLLSSAKVVNCHSKEVVQVLLDESLDCYRSLSDWTALDEWQEAAKTAKENTGVNATAAKEEMARSLRALDEGTAVPSKASRSRVDATRLTQAGAVEFCQRMLMDSISHEVSMKKLSAMEDVCFERFQVLADAIGSQEYETISTFLSLYGCQRSKMLTKEGEGPAPIVYSGHSLFEPAIARWVDRCQPEAFRQQIVRLVSQASYAGNLSYADRLKARLPEESYERLLLTFEALQGSSVEENVAAILSALSFLEDAACGEDTADLKTLAESRRQNILHLLATHLWAGQDTNADMSEAVSMVKACDAFHFRTLKNADDVDAIIAAAFEESAESQASGSGSYCFAKWSWRQGKKLMNDEGLDSETIAELEEAFVATQASEASSSIVLGAVEEMLSDWKRSPSGPLPDLAHCEEKLRSLITDEALSDGAYALLSERAHGSLEAAVQRRVHHHRRAAELFFKALQLPRTSTFKKLSRSEVERTSCLHLLRLLTEDWPLQEVFATAIKTTPPKPWLQVLPQVIARLSHPSIAVRQLLGELLTRIAQSSPQDVIFPVVVRLNTAKTNDDESGHALEGLQKIADSLNKRNPKLYTQVKSFVRELTRVTLLWHEEGIALLSKVQSQDWDCRVRAVREVSDVLSRRVLAGQLSDASAEDMLWRKYGAIMEHVVDRLSAFEQTISRDPETPLEVEFQRSFLDKYRSALEALSAPARPSEPEQCWKAFEDLANEFGKVQKTSHLSLTVLSPELSNFSSSDIKMPSNNYLVDKVTIELVSNRVVVLATKTKPKKLEFNGSDGRLYYYLLKGREDLNLDARIMQFFTVVNGLLQASTKPCSLVWRRLNARNYAVVPLAERSGLIQWVEGQLSLFQVWKQWQRNKVAVEAASANDPTPAAPQRPTEIFYSRLAPALQAHSDSLTESCDRRKPIDATPAGRKDWPHSVLKSVFLSLKADSPGDLLAHELWSSSATTAEWWKKQKLFAQSLAVTSMIGYCLGVGDRHLDNILLDTMSGEILHIDFNVCFDRGSKLRVPETVPFRLTQLLERGLGVTGVAGIFKESSKVVLETLRRHKNMLLALLEVFVYEPLTEWTQSKSALRHRSRVELAVALEHLSAKVELTKQTVEEAIDELNAAFATYVSTFCWAVGTGPSVKEAPKQSPPAIKTVAEKTSPDSQVDDGNVEDKDSLNLLMEDVQSCEQEVEEYASLLASSRMRYRDIVAGGPKQLLESCINEQARLEKSQEVLLGRHLVMLGDYLQKTKSVALMIGLRHLYGSQLPPPAVMQEDTLTERTLSERLVAADNHSLECVRLLSTLADMTRDAHPEYSRQNRCYEWLQVLRKAVCVEELSEEDIDNLEIVQSLEEDTEALEKYREELRTVTDRMEGLAVLEQRVSEAEEKNARNAAEVEQTRSILRSYDRAMLNSNISYIQAVGLVHLIEQATRLSQGCGGTDSLPENSAPADHRVTEDISDAMATVEQLMQIQMAHFASTKNGCEPPPWTVAWLTASEEVRVSALAMTSAELELGGFRLLAPQTVQQLQSIQKSFSEDLGLLIKIEELDSSAHARLSSAQNFLAMKGTNRPGGKPKKHWQQQQRQARDELSAIASRKATLQRSVESLTTRVETLFATNQQEPCFARLFSLFVELEASFSKFVVFLKAVGVNPLHRAQQQVFYCSKIDLLLSLHKASSESARDPRSVLFHHATARQGLLEFVKGFFCTLYGPICASGLDLVIRGYAKCLAPSVSADAAQADVKEYLLMNYGRTESWQVVMTAVSVLLTGRRVRVSYDRDIRTAEEALALANGEVQAIRQRQRILEVTHEDLLRRNVKGFRPQIVPLLQELNREVRQLQQVTTLEPLVRSYLQRVQELAANNTALPPGAVAEIGQRAQLLTQRVRDLTGFLQLAAAVIRFESLRCSSSPVTRNFEERVNSVIKPLRDQLRDIQGTAAGAKAAEERLRVAKEEYQILKEEIEKKERLREEKKERQRKREEERRRKEKKLLKEQRKALSQGRGKKPLPEKYVQLHNVKQRLQKELESFCSIAGEELEGLLRKVSRQYDALDDEALEEISAIAAKARSEHREVKQTVKAFLSASSPLLKSLGEKSEATEDEILAAKATAQEMKSVDPSATLQQFFDNFSRLGPLADALHTRWLSPQGRDEESNGPTDVEVKEEPQEKEKQSAYALGLLKRVRSKLKGRVGGSQEAISAADQVDYVIEQATSVDNLCHMYEGWTPWI